MFLVVFLELGYVGHFNVFVGDFGLALTTAEAATTAETTATEVAACEEATAPEQTLEPLRREHHDVTHDVIAKLLSDVKTE